MIQVESSVVIGRPADDVFQVVGDPLRDPEWHFDVQKSELISGGGAGRGAVYRWSYGIPSDGRHDAKVEVKEYDPIRRIDLIAVTQCAVQGIGYRLDQLDGSTTLLTRILVICHSDLSANMQKNMQPLLETLGTQYLVQLRQLVEGGPLDPFLAPWGETAFESGPPH